MAPEPHADHHVRLEPAIAPFLFLGRFEMYRVDLYADLAQTPAQQLTLRRQAGGRRWVFGQHKHFHDCRLHSFPGPVNHALLEASFCRLLAPSQSTRTLLLAECTVLPNCRAKTRKDP